MLFHCLNYYYPQICFTSPRSGKLEVIRQKDRLYLNFPLDTLIRLEEHSIIEECIQTKPIEIYKGKTDYLVVLNSESEVKNFKPDLDKIAFLKSRGLIITAKGNSVDFVSRFFAPQSGINEDPVTGSAHTSLIPLWADKLNKEEMTALQLSKRGGTLYCSLKDNRCLIGGYSKLFLSGKITLY